MYVYLSLLLSQPSKTYKLFLPLHLNLDSYTRVTLSTGITDIAQFENIPLHFEVDVSYKVKKNISNSYFI